MADRGCTGKPALRLSIDRESVELLNKVDAPPSPWHRTESFPKISNANQARSDFHPSLFAFYRSAS